ncbi:MAG: hypothetical protein ACK5II_02825 [Paracoccus sp. (in: a-proteobacteria)]
MTDPLHEAAGLADIGIITGMPFILSAARIRTAVAAGRTAAIVTTNSATADTADNTNPDRDQAGQKEAKATGDRINFFAVQNNGFFFINAVKPNIHNLFLSITGLPSIALVYDLKH